MTYTSRKAIARPDYVDREIREAIQREPGEWIELAQGWTPETVVHLAKHLNNREGARLLGELLERCVFPAALGVIRKNCKGLQAEDQKDVVSEVYTRIIEKILDGSPLAPDFLEAKFGLKVKQLTIDAVRKVVRSAQHQEPFGDSEEHQIDQQAVRDTEADEVEAEFGERLSAAAEAVLSTWPRRVQQAFVQHYYQGIPIESEKKGAISIASIHNVSGRAVRAWFAKIKEAVKRQVRST